MASVLADIDAKIKPGTVIQKPRSQVVVAEVWGTRRNGQPALIYTMPNKDPTKPHHRKGVTKSEWVQAAEHLSVAGDFTRAWFGQHMAVCNQDGPCNFTLIGGVFVRLGYAVYAGRDGYRKRPQTNEL